MIFFQNLGDFKEVFQIKEVYSRRSRRRGHPETAMIHIPPLNFVPFKLSPPTDFRCRHGSGNLGTKHSGHFGQDSKSGVR